MIMRRRCSEKGNAMVEFALSVPMLVFCFLGCFQFGYYFYIYNRLESTVRAGARYAALRAYDSNSSAPTSSFQTAVQNYVVYASPSGGTEPVVPGLTTSQVTLTVTMSSNVPSQMTVAINGYQLSGMFSSWTMTSKPVATFRYEGRWAPPSS